MYDFLPLGRTRSPKPPRQKIQRGEAFALLLFVFFDVAARVRVIRAETPDFGEIEHFGEHAQSAIRLIRFAPKNMMQLGDIRAPDINNLPCTNFWVDKEFD